MVVYKALSYFLPLPALISTRSWWKRPANHHFRADITNVQGYCEWMEAFGTVTSPEGKYDLHSSSFDDKTNTAVFFATYYAKHRGEGGPVPPTNKDTYTHYVYILKMDDDGKVAHMTKVWNAPWAMKELGWM